LRGVFQPARYARLWAGRRARSFVGLLRCSGLRGASRNSLRAARFTQTAAMSQLTKCAARTPRKPSAPRPPQMRARRPAHSLAASEVVLRRSRYSCTARSSIRLAVSGVCAGPAVEAPPEQGKACGQREALSSTFSLRLFERSAQRVASSAVRPQALPCAGKPPQAAGDVGRPGAHTAHRRLQNIASSPRVALPVSAPHALLLLRSLVVFRAFRIGG
jgi:hypothetical protein